MKMIVKKVAIRVAVRLQFSRKHRGESRVANSGIRKSSAHTFMNFQSRLSTLMTLNYWKTILLATLVMLPFIAGAQSESASGNGDENKTVGINQDKLNSSETLSMSQLFGVWFQRAAEAYGAEDHEAWVTALENLHRIRPFNHDVMRQLVMGYALTDRPSEAFNMMLSMQQQGLAVDWDAIDAVESLREYPLYAYLRDLMAEAGEPGGDAELLWKVDTDYPMPEALAYNEKSAHVYVGTVRDGKILVRGSDDTEFKVFAEHSTVPGLKGVFDLLVDEKRGHLWVATAAVGQYRHARRSDAGRTALLKLDIETGEKLGEFRVLPDGRPHLLGAIVQASDGTIYAADGLSPQVYRLGPTDERPEPLVGSPNFSSLRGIALSQDEKRLYVSDYDHGIFFFNLGGNLEGYALGVPPTLNLGGVDGLYQWEGYLIAIQNGVTPERVLRLELDDSGRRVANVATVAKALPEFEIPTFGAIADDELLFFASSHWRMVDNDGRPLDPPLPAVPVLRVRIDEVPDMVAEQEMLDRLQQQQESPMPPPGAP